MVEELGCPYHREPLRGLSLANLQYTPFLPHLNSYPILRSGGNFSLPDSRKLQVGDGLGGRWGWASWHKGSRAKHTKPCPVIRSLCPRHHLVHENTSELSDGPSRLRSLCGRL